MAPNSATYRIEVPDGLDVVRERLARGFTRLGGRLGTIEDDLLEVELGDAGRAQSRGVPLTDPIDLPVVARVVLYRLEGGVTACHVDLVDGLVGFRVGTRRKYAETFAKWATTIEAIAVGHEPPVR